MDVVHPSMRTLTVLAFGVFYVIALSSSQPGYIASNEISLFTGPLHSIICCCSAVRRGVSQGRKFNLISTSYEAINYYREQSINILTQSSSSFEY